MHQTENNTKKNRKQAALEAITKKLPETVCGLCGCCCDDEERKACDVRRETELLMAELQAERQVKKTEDDGFERFWAVYPKHEKKQEARKAWQKLKPDGKLQELIIREVERRKKSYDWTKEGGAFVPMPPTYLNQRRWEDEWTDRNRQSREERLGAGAYAGYRQNFLTDEELDALIMNLDEDPV